jgi:nicotinamide mononucleotide (NMN) deamidase PncC
VGLTYIAVAADTRTSSRELSFTGDRTSNRRQAAHEALRMLIAEARSIRRATS